MKLYLANGEVMEIRPGAYPAGVRIVGFEVTAHDYFRVGEKREDFERWLYENIYMRFVPNTLTAWFPRDDKCPAQLILDWMMHKVQQ